MHINYPEALGGLHTTCGMREDPIQNHHMMEEPYLLDLFLDISLRTIRYSLVCR